MSAFESHVEAIRHLAEAVVRVADVDVPELTVTDEMLIEESHGSWYELEQDETWWSAWCDVYDAIEETMGGAQVGDSNIQPDVERHKQYDTVSGSSEWTSLSVDVYASGDIGILAEYERGGEWTVLFEGRLSVTGPDAVELGREVASAEIAVLASKTGSCADTLDYWQTEMAPHAFRQRQWADVRGVGRQTVSDRKNSAEEHLDR